MINTERIVPITTVDYLTMIGTTIKLSNTSLTVVEADGIGTFTATANGNVMLANEPVISFNFAEGSTNGAVYFVADYNYKGFLNNGTAVVTSGTTVSPDRVTLYKATFGYGSVSIAQVSP